MSKLFLSLGLLCILLFAPALSNSDPTSIEEFEKVIGMSWEEYQKTPTFIQWKSGQVSKRDTCTTPGAPCTQTDSQCNGFSYCGSGAQSGQCIELNVPGFDKRNQACLVNGDACRHGTCVDDDGTGEGTHATCTMPIGSTPTVCTGATSCMSASTCSPTVSGQCDSGSPINAGQACSSSFSSNHQGDTCYQQSVGTCNAGYCERSPVVDGQTCSTPTAGTVNDCTSSTCQSGVCTSVPDTSKNSNSCSSPTTGTDNGCVHATCQSGVCGYSSDTGKDNFPCTSSATTPGECEQSICQSGSCNVVNKAEETLCTTSSTVGECQKSVCQSGTCNVVTDGAKAGDVCTSTTPGECQKAICQAGSCTAVTDESKNAYTCTPTSTMNECQKATCLTGSCVVAADISKNNDACDADSNPCTENDYCSNGVCTAGTMKTCSGTTCKYASCSNVGGTATCTPSGNKPNGFDCKDGVFRDTLNRCIPGTSNLDAAHCNNQPCIPDDSPAPFNNVGEGFCNCFPGWTGQQCFGYEPFTGTSDNPDGGVGHDAFPDGKRPAAVDAKKGDFAPTLSVNLGTRIKITVSIPSSQNKWNKEDGSDSFASTTFLKFETPSGTQTTVAERNAPISIEESNALHAEFGTISTVIPYSNKRAATTNANPFSCNYPNNENWAITTVEVPTGSGNWFDTYISELSYSQLAACGLSYIDNHDANFAYFNGTIKIERDFVLGNGRFSFDRTFSVEQDYAVLFPKNLKTITNVLVSNNTVEFWAAVTKINFDPIRQTYTITIGTAINKPYYKLELESYPAMSSGVAGPFANGVVRDWVYKGTTPGTDCLTYANADCSQEFVFETSSCDAISISDMQLKFKVVCRQNGTPDTNGECADPNADQLTQIATVDIHTGSTCPVSKDYVIQNSALTTYKDDLFTTPRTLFGISETIFAAVDFDEPPAYLETVVKAVCAYPQNHQGTVTSECPDARKVSVVTTNSPFVAGGAPATGGHKISFSFGAGDLKAKAQVAQDDYNKLQLQVDLSLTYKGTLNPNQKRSASVSRSFMISTPVAIDGKPIDDEQIQEEHYHKSSASATTFGLSILVLAIAVLL